MHRVCHNGPNLKETLIISWMNPGTQGMLKGYAKSNSGNHAPINTAQAINDGIRKTFDLWFIAW